MNPHLSPMRGAAGVGATCTTGAVPMFSGTGGTVLDDKYYFTLMFDYLGAGLSALRILYIA